MYWYLTLRVLFDHVRLWNINMNQEIDAGKPQLLPNIANIDGLG